MFLKYTKFNKWVNTAVAIVLLVLAVALGLHFPVYLSLGIWHVIIFAYILIASVAPVWALLQPRDYLNSYLLIFMIVGAVVGVFVANPSCNLAAFTSFNVDGQYMFPILFVTIACGAVSGFHSLVSSGTASKQIKNEKNSFNWHTSFLLPEWRGQRNKYNIVDNGTQIICVFPIKFLAYKQSAPTPVSERGRFACEVLQPESCMRNRRLGHISQSVPAQSVRRCKAGNRRIVKGGKARLSALRFCRAGWRTRQ